MNGPYPWHEKPWRALVGLAQQDRLGHALLLSGRPGTGTDTLGRCFAHLRLCESPTSAAAPCGSCHSCLLLAADSHPDFKVLAPAEEGKTIVIDQVRELADYYALTAHYERGKVTLIDPADAMNHAAANALLKVLEEPPAGALLILVAERFSALPMTIRSRCVRIPCEHVDPGPARAWLQRELGDTEPAQIDALLALCGGAPLLCRDLAGESESDAATRLLAAIAAIAAGRTHALTAAAAFEALSSKRLVQLFLGTTNRLILAKFNCGSYYDDTVRVPEPSLQGLVDHLHLKHLYAFVDLLFETETLLNRHSGLREADIVDSLWLGLARMTGRGG